MKYIVISIPKTKETPEAILANMLKKYKNPEDFLNNEPDAVVYGSEDFSSTLNLPQERSKHHHFVIKLNNNESAFESAWLLTKDTLSRKYINVLDLVQSEHGAKFLMAKKIEKPTHALSLTFVLCGFDDPTTASAIQSVNDLKSNPTALIERKDDNLSFGLKVEKFSENDYQGERSTIYVIACHLNDSRALERANYFKSLYPDAGFLLVPIDCPPMERKIPLKQLEEYAKNNKFILAPDFLKNPNWNANFQKGINLLFGNQDQKQESTSSSSPKTYFAEGDLSDVDIFKEKLNELHSNRNLRLNERHDVLAELLKTDDKKILQTAYEHPFFSRHHDDAKTREGLRKGMSKLFGKQPHEVWTTESQKNIKEKINQLSANDKGKKKDI